MYSVYSIRNKYNSRAYIGSTVNYERRIKRHIQTLKTNQHKNRKLQRDFIRYGGSDAFEVTELCRASTQKQILRFEQVFIDGQENPYNILKFAGKARGRKYTAVTIANMSKAAKSRVQHYDQLLENAASRKGKKLPQEHVEKMIAGVRRYHEHTIEVPYAKLTAEKVGEIYKLLDEGVSRTELAEKYGVCRTTICKIDRGESWKALHRKLYGIDRKQAKSGKNCA